MAQQIDDNFDKLGEFYLGHTRASENEPANKTFLAAEDLTTHAFIVGMTGSGKTGLAINILEEALIDDVPAIIIDPKGDLTNLALQFADLNAAEATPWLSQGDKSASQMQQLWHKLRQNSQISPQRINNLRQKMALRVFTPGQAAILPVNILPLAPPLVQNNQVLDAKANAISTALLSRAGVSAAAAVSPAQVFIAHVLLHFWQREQTPSLKDLLTCLQKPPFDSIGFLDVDVYFPLDKRHNLMLKLNTLIAAPGFDAWLKGADLNVGKYFASGEQKVPVTIFSIAHLADDDRQFFVQLLLAEIISWMRQQSGSDALRAILYMDEIAGYIPPVANPPSKGHFLSLLKQARAYGLGLVLATQNPADLDYKGLSNIGTWLIGTLQTERDRQRLLDGLKQLGDKNSDVHQLLGSLKKREFLLHSVHLKQQIIFYTRTTQSLLIGPIAIDMLKKLPNLIQDKKATAKTNSPALANAGKAQLPIVNPRINMQFKAANSGHLYRPFLGATINVFFADNKSQRAELKTYTLLIETANNVLSYNSARVIEHHHNQLNWHNAPSENCTFMPLPSALQQLKPYTRSKTVLKKTAALKIGLELFYYQPLDLLSNFGETEAEFRSRIVDAARQARLTEKNNLRNVYEKKLNALNSKRERLMIKLEREKAESFSAKVNSWAKAGGAILGAFMGTKTLSVTNANRVSSTINSVGRARKQAQDVALTEQQLASLEQQLTQLSGQFELDILKLEAAQPSLTALPISQQTIAPKNSDIEIMHCFLAWI